jgi:hypothetical protein
VLAIERNQQNHINVATGERGVNTSAVNGNVATIVDEYQRLALYDIFEGIVSKLVSGDAVMQQ